MTKKDYIAKYWEAMKAAAAGTKVFPLVILGASAVESAWGDSELTTTANNFFGIKSTDSWEAAGGEFVIRRTREVIKGKTVFIDAKFRKYKTPEDCFKNYVHFISGPRYVKAGVLTSKTPDEQIKAVAAAGYATDPNYAKTIILIMNGVKNLI